MADVGRFCIAASRWLSKPQALILSVVAVASGALFGFSDDWWMWIDRAVYLATLWLALLLQSAQDRHERAMQIKLDELIRVTEARNELIGIEDK